MLVQGAFLGLWTVPLWRSDSRIQVQFALPWRRRSSRSRGDSIGDRRRTSDRRVRMLPCSLAVIFSPRCQRLGKQASSACGIPCRRGADGNHHYPAGADPNICLAQFDISGELLGRRVHQYPLHFGPLVDAVARGEIDFDYYSAPMVVSNVDAASRSWRWRACIRGVTSYSRTRHPNDQRLEGQEDRRYAAHSTGHLLLWVMVAHVGLDPHEDIKWITVLT